MPEAKVRLEVDRVFSQEEYACLQWGFIPHDMDDKWFVYFEDGWLIFHRSWTGLWAFQVHLEPSDEGWKISEVWAAPGRHKDALLHLLDYLAVPRSDTWPYGRT